MVEEDSIVEQVVVAEPEEKKMRESIKKAGITLDVRPWVFSPFSCNRH
jgi:hypothetical protein